jgi:F-type H+-transporting ATPase subunit delta
MSSETASRKYATAVLRQLPAAEMDAAATALTGLAYVMARVPALERYCAHPQVAQFDKVAVLKEVLQLEEAPASVVRFVLLLLEQGELAMLPVIAKSLRNEVDAAQGLQAVDVVSTTPLSDAQKKHLTESLTQRLKTKVRMAFEIDPELLGGLLVRTNNRVLDGSVRGRLSAMREKLLAD